MELDILRSLFAAAVQAANPRCVLPAALPEKPAGRCVVVGAGKAAALMAQIVDQCWPDVALSGVVVTRYGHGVPAGRITVLEAGHPVPDAASEIAARRILAAVRGLNPNDLVLALMSGGGSAVMALPIEGLTLAAKQSVTRALLQSGAGIRDINAVRRGLSAIKGGRLALASAPARVTTLAISDVPGDDPAMIGSGPTVAGPTPPDVVRALLERYRIHVSAELACALANAGEVRRGANRVGDYRLIATPVMALQAAASLALASGYAPLILGDAIEGEAREVGRVLAGIALSCRQHGVPARPPCVLLSGGETSVTIGPGQTGQGGRNMECLLAMALELDGAPGIWSLAADTDGIDGSADAAGAVISPDTLTRAQSIGLSVRSSLDRHDCYNFFAAMGDLMVTGPTLTNVNDFRAVLIS
jgi:hydroxypyruvate reductase